MKIRLQILLLLLYLAPSPVMQAMEEKDSDSLRLSLLTCAPGEEIYSLFGHTAIRYENSAKGIDVVFNYGLFSFNTPNFILRFALGETDYQLGVTNYQNFAAEYEYYGRSVWQQTLNLTHTEKETLLTLLEDNYRPENRIYRYNFFYDNCATRPRDKIEESISKGNQHVIYADSIVALSDTKSFRDIVHQYTQNHPWARFGIDLCIGSEADRPIDYRQQMFAPFYLMHAFEGARIEGDSINKPLIFSTDKIVNAPLHKTMQEEGLYPTPIQSALVLFILVAAATIYGIRKKKSLWGIDIILFAAAGIAGCILAFLALFSQHPAVGSNYLLFVFQPFHLLVLPFFIQAERKSRKSYYHMLNCIILTLFMLLFPVIPQSFDLAVLPLALCLLIRSASNLILTYKKGK